MQPAAAVLKQLNNIQAGRMAQERISMAPPNGQIVSCICKSEMFLMCSSPQVLINASALPDARSR